MKLSLDFNAAQTTKAKLLSVIDAAGANTSISLNTAQTWPSADLVSVIQAAGAKKFSVSLNGAQLTPAILNPSISAAGTNTSIAINTTQAYVAANGVGFIQTAGSKNLNLEFNGAQTTKVMLQSVIGAAGANTSVSLNTAQTWPTSDLVNIVQLAG